MFTAVTESFNNITNTIIHFQFMTKITLAKLSTFVDDISIYIFLLTDDKK